MRRLLLLAFIWGWSFLFIKVAVEGMTPSTVACVRVALGATVLLVVIRARGLALPKGWTWWRHFAVVAFAGSAAPFTLLAWGEQHVSSGLTAVLNASTPFFAALLAWLLLGDRLTRVQIGGLIVGFVGVVVASGVGRGDLAGSSLLGEGASVLAGAGYGLTFAYARRHLMGLPSMVAAAGQLIGATAMLLPLAVVTSVRQGIDLDGPGVLSIVLLGVFGTGIAYILSYGLIAEVGPTRAAVVTYLIPVVAVTVGVLFLDERFSLRIVLGGLLTVAGIAILNAGNRRPAATVQPTYNP